MWVRSAPQMLAHKLSKILYQLLTLVVLDGAPLVSFETRGLIYKGWNS